METGLFDISQGDGLVVKLQLWCSTSAADFLIFFLIPMLIALEVRSMGSREVVLSQQLSPFLLSSLL
jgi:hypothetical protein